jgi:NAD(P)H-flavin reductase
MVRLDESDRIDVVIVLTGKDVPKDWPGISGKMNTALIRKYALKASSSDTFNLLCGPPGFVSSARKGFLKSGHDAKTIYEF